MATRFYTKVSGSVGVTPSSWNFANQVNPVTVPGTQTKNDGSTMTSKLEATGTTNPIAKAMGRTIIGPLAAQTISGTVKGQMRALESSGNANATLACAIKVIKPDGTDRGVVLAQTASDSLTAGHEFSAGTLTNMSFQNASEVAAMPLSSLAVSDGDYLVIEWGFRAAPTASFNITLSYGNDSATDLPEDTSTTAANNPWWEFSGTVALLVSGTLSSTLGAAAVAGTGTVEVAATLSSTLGAASAAGTGTVAVAGATNATLGAAAVAGTGTVANAGTLSATLEAASVAGAGANVASAVLNTTLANASNVGTGTNGISAALNTTFDAVTGIDAGALPVAGQLASTMAATGLAGSATNDIRATLDSTLGVVTVTGAAFNQISATLNRTLDESLVVGAGNIRTIKSTLQIPAEEVSLKVSPGAATMQIPADNIAIRLT